jgi:hypothetical protein
VTRSEVEKVVRDWLDDASVDPDLGVPPDAKVSVNATYISTIGHLKPGQSDPDSGTEVWTVTTTLYFRNEGPPEDPYDVGLAIARVLDRIEESIASDPTLGGRVLRAQWRGTNGSEPTEPPHAPENYPNAVEAHIGLTA